MDKDRIKGAGNQAKGAVKQGIGELTGDAKLEAEGRMDKAKGKVQSAVGGAKDSAREAVDDKA
ncbi:CsbD family protein [Falsiroseomonas selenitidurans]|uniref:CsbD family protein n=1 Tax=Falsiroseomonas selenitidurans TaxID=2716335 RepID=A0ABX1E5G9_9PROT|nr:CsbD family protein [Falsiroseomonas selenitidurans]NKC32429.1 CsbD family protein [Falsiroseomonas selenitidurans]